MDCLYLDELELRPGLVLLTKGSPTLLGELIAVGQWLISPDKKSSYRHAGLIVDGSGITWEQRKRRRYYHLSDYIDSEICIMDFELFTQNLFEQAHSIACKKINRGYPWLRLLVMLVPPIARRYNIGLRVCSEEVDWHLWYSKAYEYITEWKGTYPDQIHDRRCWENVSVPYEGKLLRSRG